MQTLKPKFCTLDPNYSILAHLDHLCSKLQRFLEQLKKDSKTFLRAKEDYSRRFQKVYSSPLYSNFQKCISEAFRSLHFLFEHLPVTFLSFIAQIVWHEVKKIVYAVDFKYGNAFLVHSQFDNSLNQSMFWVKSTLKQVSFFSYVFANSYSCLCAYN